MESHKKVVKVISVLMAVIGAVITLIGVLSGPAWFTVVLGVAFIIAAVIAYQSGMAYIDELIEKRKNNK